MRRLITILSIAVICGALSCPSVDARGRNNNGGGGNNTHQTNNNGGSPSRSPQSNQSNRNQGGARPGNNGGKNQGNHNQGNARPGKNDNHNQGNYNQGNHNQGNARPGNNGGNHNQGRPNGNNARPDGNHGGNHGHNQGAPSHNAPNHGGHGHSYGPGGNHGHDRPSHVGGIPNRPPHRPMMMDHPRPYHRPVPPPAFRPGPRYPTIRTILGITIGSAINMSLNYLFDCGYYITGYTNNAIYINDVRQLNMLWPNATLYYNNGMLMGSEFVYSTPYYDTNRYYTTYNMLTNSYGLPVVRENISGGFSCSWFGYDGNYVTLRFQSAMAVNGTNRYYTVLTFGC